MKLIEYIFESDINDLKKHIKQEVDNTDKDHEQLLKKIDKMLSTKGLSREQFTNRLTEVGLGYAEKTLIQKINSYDNLPEFIAMYNDIEKLPSIADLLKANNIYELFGGFKIEKDLLKELGDLELASGGINKGKFEILTQLFIKDINTNNKNYKSDSIWKSGDINAGGLALEYKLSGARIVGQGTLNSPELVYKKMIELIKSINDNNDISNLQKEQSSLLRFWNPNELEKTLDNIEKNDNNLKEIINNIDKCFQNKKNFEKCFELLIKAKYSDDLINGIIAESMLEQIPERKYKISKEEHNKFIEFVKNEQYAPISNSKPDYNKMKLIYGAFHMYFYQHTENFDYMILFKKSGDAAKGTPDGAYVVITKEEYKDFESIRTALIDKNINIATMPGYGTAREYAITITCKS